jgi:hypothetical protein
LDRVDLKLGHLHRRIDQNNAQFRVGKSGHAQVNALSSIDILVYRSIYASKCRLKG